MSRRGLQCWPIRAGLRWPPMCVVLVLLLFCIACDVILSHVTPILTPSLRFPTQPNPTQPNPTQPSHSRTQIYGLENHNPESFDDRRYQTGLYRGNLTLYNSRIAAAIEQASMIPGADPNKGVAIIGYCVSIFRSFVSTLSFIIYFRKVFTISSLLRSHHPTTTSICFHPQLSSSEAAGP